MADCSMHAGILRAVKQRKNKDNEGFFFFFTRLSKSIYYFSPIGFPDTDNIIVQLTRSNMDTVKRSVLSRLFSS